MNYKYEALQRLEFTVIDQESVYFEDRVKQVSDFDNSGFASFITPDDGCVRSFNHSQVLRSQ